MGCNDSGTPPAGWSFYEDRKVREMKERLDAVTAMLCESCRCMEADGGLYGVTGLDEWWREHQSDDEKRVRAEAELRRQEREKDLAEAERLEARARALREKVSQ
jgi:hypothetical protein